MAVPIANEKEYLDAFFKLTLRPAASADLAAWLDSFSEQQRKDFVELADSNHVVVRAFESVNRLAGNRGMPSLQAWALQVLSSERERIANALRRLSEVCKALEEAGAPVVVMKTLDHWPDLGNDLDLVSTSDHRVILKVLKEAFGATIEPRSWGDRLACKWNFSLPGLRESIEAHIGRLGQTGEHTELARGFIARRTRVAVNGLEFFAPAPEDRIIAATLQRMYRHFYFRVCDILNAASLVESGELHFHELRAIAANAGIWPGVAGFLKIISDSVRQYRGRELPLPGFVIKAATVGGDKIYARARFLRLPILPYGARLYARQLAQTVFRGNMPATLRLSLLPPLASAAAVAFKITGSDKGVW
ncbi:MAG TPA: nucleotidyltransferase family protein [Candidatus Angelobacter sp.]|nr:nucleotidyltransferase family protein [Candidatus Angelobacter sp.]